MRNEFQAVKIRDRKTNYKPMEKSKEDSDTRDQKASPVQPLMPSKAPCPFLQAEELLGSLQVQAGGDRP